MGIKDKHGNVHIVHTEAEILALLARLSSAKAA
jgi:hypothetical protein